METADSKFQEAACPQGKLGAALGILSYSNWVVHAS